MCITYQVGRKAPEFEAEIVYKNDFSSLKLNDFKNKKYLVLIFYPLNFTFVCPTEIKAFADLNEGLFIIDPEGYIQHSTINNLPIGRSVEETLRTLQAIKYNFENPDEVCPANWQLGNKTLIPSSKKPV